jgi:putative IMPACT (imprinted ancient) family translation regulator
MIESFDSEITDESYGADVSFKIELPKDNRESLVRAITDLTSGEIRITE